MVRIAVPVVTHGLPGLAIGPRSVVADRRACEQDSTDPSKDSPLAKSSHHPFNHDGRSDFLGKLEEKNGSVKIRKGE